MVIPLVGVTVLVGLVIDFIMLLGDLALVGLVDVFMLFISKYGFYETYEICEGTSTCKDGKRWKNNTALLERVYKIKTLSQESLQSFQVLMDGQWTASESL